MNETKFRKFNLKDFLITALEEQYIQEPTEIQERLIPSILKGKSVIGQSQTGSGKTLTYLLPIVHQLNTTEQVCQAIITAPTRELSDQIYKELMKLIEGNHRYRIRKLVGGTDRKRMLEYLKIPPHVIIGTPGRISDLIKHEELSVFTATTLVIDEADLMLEMGFIKDVDFIASRMAEHLQMLVFSATIPEHLQPFLKKYMENPKVAQVDAKQSASHEVEHLLVPHRYRELNELIMKICSTINPYLALIFANTKSKVDELYESLVQAGYRVERLHGGLSPRERKQTMKRIERLECEYIVATDLASRGIDIKGVSHVINVEIPDELDFFIHRVGRTGRAGVSGQAITIYREVDEHKIHALEKRGVSFKHVDIKKDEWSEIAPRKRWKPPRKSKPDVVLPKPKKVTPGYKKKLREKQAKLNKRKK
ncbi:DEAD/DEAH box helicase [Pueribacillus sp. YX66]|uniref:DEAD/DEAH box helicase n=1 Tax=Pueribacillus sp. YX66 TaxID=3229242 RepID=UPI00358CDEBE